MKIESIMKGLESRTWKLEEIETTAVADLKDMKHSRLFMFTQTDV